ncbi:MAG: class A beta-lactamase-related serine hydrolase [Candidatus Gastranaerophilales bacterium]|nr:class A beta-lactamase-related serine hydrolase [Candidatus Gastranaerophilales bacterium]
MPRPVYTQRASYTNVYTPKRKTITPVVKPVKFNKQKQQRKVNPIQTFVLIAFATFMFMFVFPFTYYNFTRHFLFGPQNQAINVDYQKLYLPTTNYLYNDTFLNVNLLKGAELKKPAMQTFYEAGEMQVLKAKLQALMKLYPNVHPSVFVWDFETGKYVDIGANETYPAASIIKIPVLLELFRSVEQGQVDLTDNMILTEYYRSGGSGSLQFARHGNVYDLDSLARVMIQDSDNTATNMIMSQLGGKIDINRAIREWGLSHTHVANWLPDLEGGNYTSAKDIGLMLYNIDNSSFLSLKSREHIVDYMSHVKNNRLLQAGLPSDAILMHKTGDIGKMLGDAGIVWTPQGRKYIVVILAKRPYNHPNGKDFIVKASSLIYSSINSANF